MQFEFGSHEIIYRYTWARLLFSVSQRKRGAVCLSIDTETNWTQTRLGFVWIFKVLLLPAEESGAGGGGGGGGGEDLEVNCNGKTKAPSISNHWGQAGVPLSRKQGSVTPWRNLPMCFIALICCLTSLSPSDYSCSRFPFRPRPQPIPQHLFLCLCLPPPSHKTLPNPTSPSVTLSLSHILCLCASRGSSLRDIFSAKHHLWPPPPSTRHLRRQRQVFSFLQVLFLPSFH